MDGIDPTRRLMFWLKAPFIADAALGLIGLALIFGERPVGWWVILFGAVRAVVGAISVWIVAPRMIARRSAGEAGEAGSGEPSEGGGKPSGSGRGKPSGSGGARPVESGRGKPGAE